VPEFINFIIYFSIIYFQLVQQVQQVEQL